MIDTRTIEGQKQHVEAKAAKARLEAAAPELLEACKFAANYFAESDRDGCTSHARWDVAAKLAQAIYKATGE